MHYCKIHRNIVGVYQGLDLNIAVSTLVKYNFQLHGLLNLRPYGKMYSDG